MQSRCRWSCALMRLVKDSLRPHIVEIRDWLSLTDRPWCLRLADDAFEVRVKTLTELCLDVRCLYSRLLY